LEAHVEHPDPIERLIVGDRRGRLELRTIREKRLSTWRHEAWGTVPEFIPA